MRNEGLSAALGCLQRDCRLILVLIIFVSCLRTVSHFLPLWFVVTTAPSRKSNKLSNGSMRARQSHGQRGLPICPTRPPRTFNVKGSWLANIFPELVVWRGEMATSPTSAGVEWPNPRGDNTRPDFSLLPPSPGLGRRFSSAPSPFHLQIFDFDVVGRMELRFRLRLAAPSRFAELSTAWE